MHHVAVGDDVFLAFEPELADVARAGLAAALDVIVKRNRLGADEPGSKSVWIAPAACGARAPLVTVQARASFGPTVKNVTRCSSA
jgi:hypothetical protein